MKRNLNQKLINLIEYYDLINANFLLSNGPLKRTIESTTHAFTGTKLEKLNKLKKKIQFIKNCDLKKNATNLVFSDGNINSKLMIIGEGPGANEDAEGKPFVGRAGQLLNKMLAAIQLDRRKVYAAGLDVYKNIEWLGEKANWKGDNRLISVDNQKIKELGWIPKYGSKEAIVKAVRETT